MTNKRCAGNIEDRVYVKEREKKGAFTKQYNQSYGFSEFIFGKIRRVFLGVYFIEEFWCFSESTLLNFEFPKIWISFRLFYIFQIIGEIISEHELLRTEQFFIV